MGENDLIKRQYDLIEQDLSSKHMVTADLTSECDALSFVAKNLFRLKDESGWFKLFLNILSFREYRENYENIIGMTYSIRFNPFQNEYTFYKDGLTYLKALKEKLNFEQSINSICSNNILGKEDSINNEFLKIKKEVIVSFSCNNLNEHNLYISDIDIILLYFYESLDKVSISTNIALNPKQTLEVSLKDNGFYNIEFVQRLNIGQKNKLLELIISSKKLKHKIAILHQIKFIESLKTNGFTGIRLHKVLAYITNNGINDRDIKGYINYLDGLEGDKRRSYTPEEIELTKKNLNKLKKNTQI